MNVSRVIEFIQAVLDLENGLRIQSRLQELDGRLQEMLNDPQHGQHQSDAINSLADLKGSLDTMSAELTPAQLDFLVERQVSYYFGPSLSTEIEKRFAANGITPAVVKEFVGEKLAGRARVLDQFRGAVSSLGELGFKAEELKPGEAEVGFTIPRSIFENSLDGLAREFKTIDRIMGIFSETVTGKRERTAVGDLSSTDPLILIPTVLGVAIAVGKTVTWLLDTYERTLRIRKLKVESKEVGMGEEMLKGYQDLVEKTINEAISARVGELLPKVKTARQQELSNGLTWAMNAILARVERGMTVEVRFLPPPAIETETDEERAAAQERLKPYEELGQVQQALQFPIEREAEPTLKLPPPEPPKVVTAEKKSRKPRKSKKSEEVMPPPTPASEAQPNGAAG